MFQKYKKEQSPKHSEDPGTGRFADRYDQEEDHYETFKVKGEKAHHVLRTSFEIEATERQCL